MTPIRTATNTALKPIDLGYGNQIDSIAITPNGKTAYVGTIAGTVVPIRVATNKPGQPIHAGDNPSDIEFSQNGKTAYVTNAGGTR